MKKLLVLAILLSLLSGCAKPIYSVDRSGGLASVTYVRHDVNHYISEQTGEIVPAAEKETFAGKMISTEYRRTFPTAIYLYQSVECSKNPTIMGRLDLKRPKTASATFQVKAGAPLVNSFRTKFQSCQRDCYKYFYTSSVFTPEENAHYEVVVEPIDGVTVYKLENGAKHLLEVTSNLPKACQF